MKPGTAIRGSLITLAFLVCGYLVLEFSARGLYRLLNAKSLPFKELQSERKSISTGHHREQAPPGGILTWRYVREVIHPYLGFVRDPDQMTAHNRHGFFGPDPLAETRSQPDLTVGVLGGSFAEAVAREAGDILVAELRQARFFQERDIKILTLSMGGYKQPQQLMTLTYFLALGARFDIVINIDGFNELALPVTENLPKNIYPAYPRAWFMRVKDLKDSPTLLMLGRIAVLQEKKRQWAETFSRRPLSVSAIANLIWKLLDRRLENKIIAANISLQEHKSPGENRGSYLVTGPGFLPDSQGNIYPLLTEIWENCSRQMDRICRANQIAYFHFLQPNQYLPGSKPMTAEERRIAFQIDHPCKESVEQGYPLLIEAGTRLQSEGINFRDLTGLFRDNDEILYVDNACHLNRHGHQMVAEEIGRFIRARVVDNSGEESRSISPRP